MSDSINQFLAPALLLFVTGFLGAMYKRNLICVFMCIELMLCGAMLAMLSFASAYDDMQGGVFTFFVLTIAAAEVALGLAIITRLFIVSKTVNTSNLTNLGD